MSDAKAMTLRVSDELYAEMKLYAALERKSVADLVRDAITEYIERRKADPEFQRLLRAHWAEMEATFTRLLT